MFPRRNLAIVSILCAMLFVGISLSAKWAPSRPVIDVVGSSQGISSTCQLRDIGATTGGKGDVAILRDANCPGALAQGSAYYVVFVHRIGEANASKNMAFQYEPGFIGDRESPAPTIVWKTDSSLHIVAPGLLERVVKMRRNVEGITLDYNVGTILSQDADAVSP